MRATGARPAVLGTLAAAALLGGHAATAGATEGLAPAKLVPVPSRVALGQRHVSVPPTAGLKVWGHVITGNRPRAGARLTVTTISGGVTTRTLSATTSSTGAFVAYVPAYVGEWVRVSLPTSGDLRGASAQESVSVVG